MRRTLLSLSIAAAISLPVLVQANPLTDQGGDQTVSGDQTYTLQVVKRSLKAQKRSRHFS